MTGEPILYVGTVGEGLWRSTDGGQGWQRLKNGILSECEVRSIVVNPSDPRHLVIGTNEGIFVSFDGAERFEPCGGEVAQTVVWSLALSPHQPNLLLAGTRPARVYQSSDQGRSWQRLAAPIEERAENPALRYNRVTYVGFDPHQPQRYWAGVEIGGIFTSGDGGSSWQHSTRGLSSLDIHGLAIVPTGQGRRCVASTDNDINFSTDEAGSWQPQQATGQMPHPYCRALVQHPARPEVLYLGNGDGPPGSVGAALRSDDGGLSWRVLPLPRATNSTVWNFAVHPADPRRVFASSVSGQVFVTTDDGASWRQLPREFGEIRALAWSPPLGA